MMRTKSQFSQNVYAICDRIWCNLHLRHTTTEKYDNSAKGWYFRFDDDNNTSYKYILSITWTEMGQLNTYNPIWYILMTKVIERTSSMLDTPPQDKLYRRLQVFNACEHSCIMMIMGVKCLKQNTTLRPYIFCPWHTPKTVQYKGGGGGELQYPATQTTTQSGAGQRKHQSSASLAFERGIHQ